MSVETVVSLQSLIDKVPDYARDLRLNWSSLEQGTELNDNQKWGTFVAAAYGARNPHLAVAVAEAAAAHIAPEQVNAAKGAAAIMSMNNIYYRFQHLSSNEKYATMPARLRMNIMRTHGVNDADFELWALAVSAINGCGKCVDSHEKVLREKAVSEEVILGAVRIAAVVNAVASVLDAEVIAG